MSWYQFIDYFFLYFHLIFTIFNLTGWIFVKTRNLHFYTIMITFISWFGLGIFYGVGYCPLTDWHWQVREKLGHTDMPHSYIKFLIDHFTGLNVDAKFVDAMTFACFFICFVLAVILKVQKIRKKPK